MNSDRLRKLAKSVNDDRAKKRFKEEEVAKLRELDELKIKSDRQIREWPTFIEEKVEEAARSGEFSYTFECGDCEERVLSELFVYFVDLEPSMTMIEKTEVVNYDMGTYNTYRVCGILFRW